MKTMKGYIVRETAKYIYTQEVVHLVEERWFIDFEQAEGIYIGCTVYNTLEEAEREVSHEAMLFGLKAENAVIRHETCQETRVVSHRYKKG